MWTEPSTGRPLAAPVAAGRGVARELYRSKVNVPPSRVETVRAERLARLRELHAQVHAPSRAQLRAMAAEVRSPGVLARLRTARDRMDRVDRDVKAWRRGAGRRAALPATLAKARDESFNQYLQAWTAARSLVASVEAVQPRLSRRELAGLRDTVHRATSRPGRLTFGGSGRLAVRSSRTVPEMSPERLGSGARAPGPRPGWQVEYRRLSLLIHEQDSLTASAVPGSAGQRAALAEGSRLRALAVSVRGG